MEKKYTQKFRKEWINNPKLKEWISECKDPEKAYCKYCKCEINAKLYVLNVHAESKKHINAVERIGSTNQLPFKPVSLKIQQQEASLCMFSAVHASISTVDHLGEVCKNRLECSSLKLHRTKCTNIIKNVLGPHFDDELRKDIGEGYFSILIDESCDVALTKVLGLALIYFSSNLGKIVSTFLSIEELESGSAENIVIGVKNALRKFNLKTEKLVGIATDNANVMLAVNQSLKEYLPEQLEFLVFETYSWFSKSSKRQVVYKNLYKNLNEKDPLKIPKTSDTRWLSIETSVSRILSQWEELKVHFETAYMEEKCLKAKILCELYNEDNIRLYLLFLNFT
ncbi:uncharacterized protein LOC119603467 [Lucilia sericata]|uniref:uncharacterized protein LOC119603467 n=1 Tax=Lucilia sericata TaxID=13632 RepID=UPI0018A7EBED|nr:uncharacterized protein LOC119603467 [Lucilia sericata]